MLAHDDGVDATYVFVFVNDRGSSRGGFSSRRQYYLHRRKGNPTNDCDQDGKYRRGRFQCAYKGRCTKRRYRREDGLSGLHRRWNGV
eukprot:scaffold4814_cov161-Amphora_coffeaeformis.AAC.1